MKPKLILELYDLVDDYGPFDVNEIWAIREILIRECRRTQDDRCCATRLLSERILKRVFNIEVVTREEEVPL